MFGDFSRKLQYKYIKEYIYICLNSISNVNLNGVNPNLNG